jgi:hypothetical protein
MEAEDDRPMLTDRDRVSEVLGYLMERHGMCPKPYRETFSTDRELERLGD